MNATRLTLALAALLAPHLALSTASAQVSTSLGGDLSGRPSAAVVSKLRGVPLGSTAPVSGSYLRYDGAGWDADPGPSTGGGGGSVTFPYESLGTLNVTSTLACTTTPVTLSSWTIPAADYAAGRGVEWFLQGTYNATTTLPLTYRLFVRGAPAMLAGPSNGGAATGGKWLTRGYLAIRARNADGGLFGFFGFGNPTVASGPNGVSTPGNNNLQWGFGMTIPLPQGPGEALCEITGVAGNNNPGNSWTIEFEDVWIRRRDAH